MRDGAAAGHQDRERASRRHARGQPRGLRARRAGDALRGGRALEGRGRRAAARAAVRSRRGRGARRSSPSCSSGSAGSTTPPSEIARSLADRADRRRLSGQGAPGRGARRRSAPRRRRSRRCARRRGWRSRTTTPRRSSGRTSSCPRRRSSRWICRRRWRRRAGWSTPCPTRCAGACSWRRVGLGDGRARSRRRRRCAAAIEIEPNDVEARILLAELQVATNKIAAAKAGFRDAIDRAEAPMAGRATPSRAGWCCAARSPRRRSWPIAWSRTPATPTRSRRRARSSAPSSAPSARWRWPSGRAKLGLAAGPARAAAGRGAALAKEDKAGRGRRAT